MPGALNDAMKKRMPQVLNIGAALSGGAAGLMFGLEAPWAPPLGIALAVGTMGMLAGSWRAGHPGAVKERASGGAMADLIRMAAEESGEGLLVATWDGVGMYANEAFRELFFMEGEGGTAGDFLKPIEFTDEARKFIERYLIQKDLEAQGFSVNSNFNAESALASLSPLATSSWDFA